MEVFLSPFATNCCQTAFLYDIKDPPDLSHELFHVIFPLEDKRTQVLECDVVLHIFSEAIILHVDLKVKAGHLSKMVQDNPDIITARNKKDSCVTFTLYSVFTCLES